MTDSFINFQDFDAYGFDLDHTILKYKLVNAFNLSYDCVTDYLVEKGYDKRIQHDLEKYKDFISKGLVLDIGKGNIIKLGSKGEVIQGKHGTKSLSHDELIQIYGEDLKFEHSDVIFKTMQNSVNYRYFENYFDTPGLVAMARLIDIIDEKKMTYEEVWIDVMKALQNCYTFQGFKLDTGGFFPALKKEPHKYLEKCSADVKKWLKSLKEGKKCVFLVTSSYVDFASFTSEYILGKDWREYFDICVFYARKPSFFSDKNPFLRIEGDSEKEPVTELKVGGFYSQGNFGELDKFISDYTGKKDPKVVYFGDNICADCYPSKTYADWSAVLILEEMDAEGYLCSDGTVPGHKHDGESNNKKAKFEVNITNEWGPFLCYGDQKGTKVMNTFWGSVISKYSCITVPSLEYLSGVPLDHKFKKFSEEDGNIEGFHPGIPSSLLP
ncbi:hypothetical protein LOTGIDRAFT_108569 [Lottia gigantea]|uniref:5'-nucleotidase domain-containing protein 1 n=1 Tax=Lottia gigantea TaxID=225164 RepID=V3ZTL6_LOTGI|nr:hypothetical protein LOTGIDRAFT_108569 [Lottia gigantea]ESO84261.1 hypothetical protein LOTGIDRAFT_108569 [Lottia gigantea]